MKRTSNEHYTEQRLKRSLAHFLLGKVAGLTIGAAWVLLLVRALEPADYGRYVAFTGIGEVLQLALAFGLMLISERYLPELRIQGDEHRLTWAVWHWLKWRLALLAGGCAVVAVSGQALLAWAGLAGLQTALLFFLISTVAEGTARHAESMFDSLLMQSYSQVSILFRYGLRVVALAVLHAGGQPLSLDHWMAVEAACFCASLLLTGFLLWRGLPALREGRASAAGPSLPWARHLRYAAPVYVAELIALAASIETVKVLVNRLDGADAAALYGFCATLALMLQRYLPNFLLIGMIRPMFVAALHGPQAERDLNRLFGVLTQLNLFIMAPAVVAAWWFGDRIVLALSGGQLAHGGSMLAAMLLLVLTQALRAVINLLIMVFEEGRRRLWAAVAGASVFALVPALLPQTDSLSLVLGLVAADVVAGLFMLHAGVRRHLSLHWSLAPVLKITAGCMGATLAALAADMLLRAHAWAWAAALGAGGLAYLILLAMLRPFGTDERRLINSLLPRPVFIW
ncbi:MAG: lipopolysaccharide biosynthesis protein [Pseudomonadota bacterium]